MHVCERVCVKGSRLCRQDDGCRQHSVHAYGGPSGRCWHHESACRGSAPRLNSNVSLRETLVCIKRPRCDTNGGSEVFDGRVM